MHARGFRGPYEIQRAQSCLLGSSQRYFSSPPIAPEGPLTHIPSFPTSLRGGITETDRKNMWSPAFGHLVAVDKEQARRAWMSLRSPEAAHGMHATRGARFFKEGILAREFINEGTLQRQESLADACNGIYMPRDLHSLFDTKQLVVIPGLDDTSNTTPTLSVVERAASHHTRRRIAIGTCNEVLVALLHANSSSTKLCCQAAKPELQT